MTKGERTKQRIIDAAFALFAEKGFDAVSMKDVCCASELSRGGLYAHFSSTSDIMDAIIDREQSYAYRALETALKGGVSPDVIVKGFLSKRAYEISDPAGSVSGAIQQYAKSSEHGLKKVQKRAEDAVKILTRMISLGQEQGIFKDGDAEEYACALLWMTEGMNAHAELLGMTKERAFRQMDLSVRMLKSDGFQER